MLFFSSKCRIFSLLVLLIILDIVYGINERSAGTSTIVEQNNDEITEEQESSDLKNENNEMERKEIPSKFANLSVEIPNEPLYSNTSDDEDEFKETEIESSDREKAKKHETDKQKETKEKRKGIRIGFSPGSTISSLFMRTHRNSVGKGILLGDSGHLPSSSKAKYKSRPKKNKFHTSAVVKYLKSRLAEKASSSEPPSLLSYLFPALKGIITSFKMKKSETKFHYKILKNEDGKYEYSVDGKKSIKDYIENSYLNKNFVYNEDKVAESVKICDEFEKKIYLPNKAKLEEKKNQGEKLIEKWQALDNTHNFCENEFKQKHMEKIFLFMHQIAVILIEYRIAKGHNSNVANKPDNENDNDYCAIIKIRTQQLEREDVNKAMKALFKAEKKCFKEFNEFREMTDPFCKGGNQSEFGRWIEANFGENKRDEAHRVLKKHCAYIEMSSLSIYWCSDDQKYEMLNGESVLEKQESIKKLQHNDYQKYVNEMKNICNQLQKLHDNEQKVEDLLAIISEQTNQMEIISKNCDDFKYINEINTHPKSSYFRSKSF